MVADAEAEAYCLASKEQEQIAKEKVRAKHDRIFNACLLDKSTDVDVHFSSVEGAVRHISISRNENMCCDSSVLLASCSIYFRTHIVFANAVKQQTRTSSTKEA